jgi:hypothetical protein
MNLIHEHRMSHVLETECGESKINVRGYCPYCGRSIGYGTATNTMCDGMHHDGPFIEVCVKCIRLHFPNRLSCVCGWDLVLCYRE